MKRIWTIRNWMWLAGALLLSPAASSGQSGPTSRPDEEIVYQAPPHAVLGRRMDAAVHQGPDDAPCLRVLAPPDHVGLTVRDRPAIFYYLSKATDKKLRIIVSHEMDYPAALDMTIDPKPGIQRIDLSDGKFTMAPNEMYKLTLMLIVDPDENSKNVVVGCQIKRIDAPYTLLAELGKRADLREKAVAFVQNHIWFDALAALSQKIDSVSQNKSLREDRARLLDREGLSEAADFDRESVHAAVEMGGILAETH